MFDADHPRFCSIAKFHTEAEMIEKANATEYGLGAEVFTNDVSRAQRISEELESGQVTSIAGACSMPTLRLGE
jgi:aldehyde dehydrogenase (NAD+)